MGRRALNSESRSKTQADAAGSSINRNANPNLPPSTGLVEAQTVVVGAVSQLLGGEPLLSNAASADGSTLRFCNYANATICEPSVRLSREGRSIRVVVYNPVAWTVRAPLRVAVSTHTSCEWIVQGLRVVQGEWSGMPWACKVVVLPLEDLRGCGMSLWTCFKHLQQAWCGIRALRSHTHDPPHPHPCSRLSITGPNNETLPSQTVSVDATTRRLQHLLHETNASSEAAGDAEVAWVADLQPLGLATFTMLPASVGRAERDVVSGAGPRRRRDEVLDNGILRLVFDAEAGECRDGRGLGGQCEALRSESRFESRPRILHGGRADGRCHLPGFDCTKHLPAVPLPPAYVHILCYPCKRCTHPSSTPPTSQYRQPEGHRHRWRGAHPADHLPGLVQLQ